MLRPEALPSLYQWPPSPHHVRLLTAVHVHVRVHVQLLTGLSGVLAPVHITLRSSTMRQREPKPTHRLWAGFGTVDAFHDNVASIHTSRQPLGSLIGTNRAFMGRSRGQVQEVADWMWSAEAEPLRSSTVTAPPADDCCWYGRRAILTFELDGLVKASTLQARPA